MKSLYVGLIGFRRYFYQKSVAGNITVKFYYQVQFPPTLYFSKRYKLTKIYSDVFQQCPRLLYLMIKL